MEISYVKNLFLRFLGVRQRIWPNTVDILFRLGLNLKMCYRYFYMTQWIQIFMWIGFFIKLPLFGFHLWLPKAHVEASTEGSMILASILLKLGVFGLIRLNDCIERYPERFPIFITCWVLIGLFIRAKICFRQNDLKIFIAYSSVVHMLIVGLIFKKTKAYYIFGLFLLSVGHGFCSALLFYFVGKFYYYSGRRKINIKFGKMWFFPWLMFIWVFILVINCKFPPTIKFFSEIFIFFCSSISLKFILIGVMISVFLGGLFKIYLFMKTTHGKRNQKLKLNMNPSYKFTLVNILFLVLKIISIAWVFLI